MSVCQYKARLDAYHDNQLEASEARRMAEHISGCAECAGELGRLCELSQALSQVRFEELSQIELARLHRNLSRGEDRGLLRLAIGLSAAAASILIISLAWLTQAPVAAPRSIAGHDVTPLPVWERLASGEDPSHFAVPGIRSPGAAPANTGVAQASDRDTIDWMLKSVPR